MEKFRDNILQQIKVATAAAQQAAASAQAAQVSQQHASSVAATARANIMMQQHLASDISFSDKQGSMRGQYAFTKALRTELEVVRALVGLDDGDAPELAEMNRALEYMRRLLDLRLAAIRAAMLYNGPSSHMKLEIAENYYTNLLSKTQKTEGKWATGEKGFGEIHHDVLEQAVRNLPKLARDSPGGSAGGPHKHHRGGFGRGFGRGGGRGGRGEAGNAGGGGAAGNQE